MDAPSSQSQIDALRRQIDALEQRQANLSLLDGLVNEVAGALDVRAVLDRIFAISEPVLRHDAMSIAMPHADREHITLHAVTGALRHLRVPWEQKLRDTSLVQREWESVLIDDLPANPTYAPLPAVKEGMRSLIVIPVRLEGELRAWVNFWSRTPGHFTTTDVPIARRVAAYVGLILSHQRLAEQIRQNEELRLQSSNQELLDQFLAAVDDSATIETVFEAVTAIAAK